MSTIVVSAGQSAPRRRAATGCSAGGAPRSPLRLSRRGRLLLSGLTLALLTCAGVLASGGAPAVAGSERAEAAVADRVTVRPGETLWAIAQREAPGVDPRETIAEILDLNALESAAVEAGSVLLLPAG